MDRLFISDPNEPLQMGIRCIDREESHHLIQVRRKRLGDRVEVLDGKGTIGMAVVVKTDPKHAEIELKEIQSVPLPKRKLTFYLAMPKSGTLEPILQKATELGVSAIQPIITAHTEGLKKLDKVERKWERWNSILVESCKQSGNPFLPQLSYPIKFEQAIAQSDGTHRVTLALTDDSVPINTWGSIRNFSEAVSLSLFMGPEGDFSVDEYAQLRSLGSDFVSLGPLVLRMETAAIAGIAIVQSWVR